MRAERDVAFKLELEAWPFNEDAADDKALLRQLAHALTPHMKSSSLATERPARLFPELHFVFVAEIVTTAAAVATIVAAVDHFIRRVRSRGARRAKLCVQAGKTRVEIEQEMRPEDVQRIIAVVLGRKH